MTPLRGAPFGFMAEVRALSPGTPGRTDAAVRPAQACFRQGPGLSDGHSAIFPAAVGESP